MPTCPSATRASNTLIGPLIDRNALDAMRAALANARADGGVVHGGAVATDGVPGGAYAAPALIEMPGQTETVKTETFAPILYVMEYDALEEAIAMQNAVPQGLSSCIFTLNVREAETFLSAVGSDCGIANVNIGPSGAEIGGAFGGEGSRRWARKRVGRLERLHAPSNLDRQLLDRTASCSRSRIRHLITGPRHDRFSPFRRYSRRCFPPPCPTCIAPRCRDTAR